MMKAIYGFVFYLLTYVFLGLYITCVIVPDHWLHSLGLTYLPSKYWLIVVPVHLMVLLVTLFIVYMGYSMAITPSLDDLRTITSDTQAIFDVLLEEDVCSDNRESLNEKTPVLKSITISQVCRNLYEY